VMQNQFGHEKRDTQSRRRMGCIFKTLVPSLVIVSMSAFGTKRTFHFALNMRSARLSPYLRLEADLDLEFYAAVILRAFECSTGWAWERKKAAFSVTFLTNLSRGEDQIPWRYCNQINVQSD
ncbi:MAG: hypothetical protein WB475_16670, partial [Pseudolabrys sp.]